MKKNILILLSLLMLILNFAGCSFASSDTSSYIKEYLYDNIDYKLDDLRVVTEENKTLTVVVTFE